LNVSDSSVDLAATLWQKTVAVTIQRFSGNGDEIQNSSSAGLNWRRICPQCAIARTSLGHGLNLPLWLGSGPAELPAGPTTVISQHQFEFVNPSLTISGSGWAPDDCVVHLKKNATAA